MFGPISLQIQDFLRFLPESYLIIIVCSFLIFISFFYLITNNVNKSHYELLLLCEDLIFSLFIIFVIFYLSNSLETTQAFLIFNLSVLVDYFSYYIGWFILILCVFIYFFLFTFLRKTTVFLFEYPLLLLFSILLLLLLLSIFNFIGLYIILESVSLLIYVLIIISNVNYNAVMSSLKYFCIGVIASGCLLYGIVLLYILSGSVNFLTIFWKLFFLTSMHSTPFTLYMSILFICLGFLIKLGVFPMHLWIIDIYNGCSRVFLFFLLIVFKTVILLIFTRILFFLFYNLFFIWHPLLLCSGLGSIIFGALGALSQKKIKRFLAYTSINQVGFFLMGVSVGTFNALYSIILYLFFYICAMCIFFMVYLHSFVYTGQPIILISDFTGLSLTSSFYAMYLTVSILSMAGIPPFVGFMAKFWLFSTLFFAGYYTTGGIVLFFSFVSAVYYLRVLKCIWFNDAQMSASNCYTYLFDDAPIFLKEYKALIFFPHISGIFDYFLLFLNFFLIFWFVNPFNIYYFLLKLSCVLMCPLMF